MRQCGAAQIAYADILGRWGLDTAAAAHRKTGDSPDYANTEHTIFIAFVHNQSWTNVTLNYPIG